MRQTAFTLALLTIVAISPNTQADDFSALLADLSFNDLPSLNKPLTVAKANPVAKLKPAPQATKAKSTLSSVALQDPIPAQGPAIRGKIDLESVFTAQEQISAQSVGHLLHRDQGCDSGCSETIIDCSPHVKPNLPSSTLHQYFRTNKCNTHVWDNYRQPCRKSNSHVSGNCDCFKNKSDCSSCEIIELNDCRSCDGR